jgi:hypothetical protein
VLELTERFGDIPILAEVGDQLDAAFARGAHPRCVTRSAGWNAALRGRRTTRSLALAIVLLVLLAATAAAATLLVLRGSVIPSPSAQDVQPAMRPIAGSERLLDLRATDPARGIASWGIRIARSETGLVCSTVGQVVGGQLGVIGFDGRYREMPAGVLDSCGQEHHDAAALIGARVFDAKRRADVRTVLYGVAGDDLRAVTIVTPAAQRPLAIGPGGAFLTALTGYPEDSALRVVLRFADGSQQIKDIGRDPFVAPDPGGGPAWRVSGGIVDGSTGLCVTFSQARPSRRSPASSPACGRTRGPRDGRSSEPYFFAIRRFGPGDHGHLGMRRWSWGNFPARTAVWGDVRSDLVRSLAISTASGIRPVHPGAGGTFLVMFGPKVDPRSMRVEVLMRDGRHLTFTRSAGLITPRKRHP